MSEGRPELVLSTSRRRWLVLGTLFLFGLLVRGHHAFGETLSFTWHPDEGHVVVETLRVFCARPGDIDLRYPPLLPLLLGPLSGGNCEQPILIANARALSIFAGAASGPIVAAAIWRADPDRWAAVAAGSLLTLTPLAIRMSRYGKPDMLASFGVALCLLACVRLLEAPSDRRTLGLGLALGVTAMAKYTAVVVPLVASVFVLLGTQSLTQGLRRLAVAGLAALAFSLALMLCFDASLADLRVGLSYEWSHYNVRGHAGFDHEHPIMPALAHLLRSSPGPLAMLLAGYGLSFGLRRDESTRRLQVGLLVGWVLACTMLAAAALFFARSLLPFLVVLAYWMGRGLRQLSPGPSTTLLAAACIIWPSIQAARQLPAFMTEDSRVVARRELPELCAADCRLAYSPASVERVLSAHRRQHSQNVGNPPSVAQMRARGFTHFLYGAGTMRRFRKYPERYAFEDTYLQRFTADLRAHATLVGAWEGPSLPGDELFGDAGFLHHHAGLELWKLEAPPAPAE